MRIIIPKLKVGDLLYVKGRVYYHKKNPQNKNKQDTQNLINNITEIINNTDFSYLYNPKTKLLSVGFNLEDNKLTDSYYDFLLI